MAASAKFDSVTNSPDSNSYMNSQRVPYGVSLDRSGSFRDGMEGRMQAPATSSTRSYSMQADAISLFQSLLPELKQIVVDQKYPRQADVKKLLSSAVTGFHDDASSHNFSTKMSPLSSSEEFRRAKTILHDSVIKARERAKYFGEILSKYDKYFPNNSTKKRSRTEMSSMDRPALIVSKNGSQVHPGFGVLDPASQRPEERCKGVLPSRRIRTSMVADSRLEQRANNSLKPCNTIGRERDALKLVTGNASFQEGWEKGKMKKRRTSVRPDASDQSVVNSRPTAGDRDPKQGFQQRLGSDAQQRLGNALGFRPNDRECTPSASPSAVANRSSMNARAPRSNGAPSSRASPGVHRTAGSPEESDIPTFIPKCNSGLPSSNRKRSAQTQSSSPPVTQWVGQRLQKMSRPARRTNFPHVSGHEDNQFSDVETRTNDAVELSRNTSFSSGQFKATGDPAYSTALSESEESAIAENKSKEKIKKCAELEEKGGHTLQKAAVLSFPARKKQTSGDGEEEICDGTRRLARPRAFPPLRPGLPSNVEKLELTGSAKQPRNVKLDSERVECKPGRPTNKKIQERKGYPRPRCDALELNGEPEDDHDELFVAANHALNSRNACSNIFWKSVEPSFSLISEEKISFLKKQCDINYCSLPEVEAKGIRDGCEAAVNGAVISRCDGILGHPPEDDHVDELSLEVSIQPTEVHPRISMCQLLLSAIIEEAEENEPCYCKGQEEECFSNEMCSVQFVSNFDTKADEMDHLPLENAQRVRAYSNGYIVNARFQYFDEHNHRNLESYNMGTEYSQMTIDDRILLELSVIGLSPEPMPDLAQSDEELNEGVRRLEEKLHEEVSSKGKMLAKLDKTLVQAKDDQERALERIALDHLVSIAYKKYVAAWSSSSSASKNANKIAKLRAMSFVKRTLARCQTFKETGKSCFSESPFKEMFQSINNNTVESEDADFAAGHLSVPTQAGLKSSKHEKCFDTVPINLTDNSLAKDDVLSSKVKKREFFLNVGVGNLVSGTKGKRSERDRDGKRNSRDASARNGTSRVGRPALSNKGERKNKPKPKHKMSQLSTSLSDLPGIETLPLEPKLHEVIHDENTKKDESGMVAQDISEHGAIDLSNLPLPGDDFGTQPHDFGTWFNNLDDEGLQDQDLVGLEIPMDDLSELNMVL